MTRRRKAALAATALVFAVAAAAVALALRSRKDRAAEAAAAEAPVASCVTEALRLIAAVETCGPDRTNVTGRIFNASGKTAKDFEKFYRSVPGDDRHLWMAGQDRWLVVGRAAGSKVPLAAAMDAISAIEGARYSLPELFACYAGADAEILPAFDSPPDGEVLPEWFVTKDVPEIGWLDAAGVDSDILDAAKAEMRSMQVVRREALKGCMAAREAKDVKGERAACEIWARCALRNPRDPFVLERIERLERNARGFLSVGKLLQAMKCYETAILIQPKNAAAVHNFGLCLKKIGKKEMAEQALRRAETLARAAEAESADDATPLP